MTSQEADEQADFTGFVDSQTQPLLRLAYVLTGQREAAEDLVQETLLAVYRRWGRVVRTRHRNAYVRRMLVNQYLSGARRRRWVERPLDESRAAHGSATSAFDADDALWRALSGLTARQQAVLSLRYFEDLDDERIGAILRCRPGTVRSLVSRALASLRDSPHLQIHDSAESRAEDG